MNFRSDLDGDIYHDNDGCQSSISTPMRRLIVERMERLLKYSFPPSFILNLPCEVYFQEAISIYKVDFNLFIDLCFQDVLRKLVSEDREHKYTGCPQKKYLLALEGHSTCKNSRN